MLILKNKLWELLFNSIDEGFCIIEMIFDEQKKPVDYRFLMLNASFERQTGLIDATGKRIRELVPNHEEFWFEMYGKIALTGEAVRFENHAEQLHRWYDVYAFRFGKPQDFQVAVLFNDITERKGTEAKVRLLNKALTDKVNQLEYANKKLREAEKIKSEFFANVSHELRTPLSLILSPLESILSQKYGTLNSEQSQTLQILHNNAIRLLQLVNGLLDFAKLEAGKMKANREPLNIENLIHSILNDFTSMISSKRLSLTHKIEIQGEQMLMDRYLFERIFFNLFSNAIKYTPEGGQIIVKCKSKKNILEISVEDTGIGIASEDLKKLFEKFMQVESSSTRRFSGSGLGLAMIKEFTELLDGNVSVKSKLGKGSVFTVKLLAPATGEEDKSILPKQKMLLPHYHISAPDFKKNLKRSEQLKVLVCEDNEELSTYIVSLLSNFCLIKTTKDGEEGLLAVKEWLPDLVITDVMMPKKDGYELCQQIKSNPDTSKIIVVMLTALTHREAMIRGWEAKVDDYLFKPFHPDELVSRIRSLLSIVSERKIVGKEIEKYTQELEITNKKLAYSNRELEQFAYVASHDLQEPLHIMTNIVTLFEEKYSGKTDEETERYLKFIVTASARMQQLIRDLLDFSRIGGKIDFTLVDCNKVFKDILADLSHVIKESNANIKSSFLPIILGNEILLKQLFQNLIGNAIKFRKKNVIPEITISAEEKDTEYVFSIRDNGIGIEEKYVKKLFILFQRLHTASEYPGTGIGLASCKKIAILHKGKIWIESQPGEGSIFYFTISKEI